MTTGDQDNRQIDNTSDSLQTAAPNSARVAPFIALVLVSAIFFNVVHSFLISLCLAAICAVLARPLFLKLLHLFKGREGLASTLTLLICLLAVIVPMMFVTYEAATQAVEVFDGSDELLNILAEDVQELKDGTLQLPEWVPFKSELESAGPQIFEKANELMGSVASFFASSLTHLTNGTATFFLSLFTFLYAMFFFLPMKRSVFAQLLSYSGLSPDLQDKLDNRIVSVSRATIKGSLLIGVVQGALGGLGFWAVGFEGAAFWSVIMAILAAIPAVGATPVVFCGAIYLGVEGETAKAIGLALWAMLVVGSIDNVLRPRLVGKDAGMSDLWIFVSTLGGLGTFGASGLVLGPVVAGLFITIWTELTHPHNPQPEDTEEKPGDAAPREKVPDPPKSASGKGGYRLTATKTEMEEELAELKRELKED